MFFLDLTVLRITVYCINEMITQNHLSITLAITVTVDDTYSLCKGTTQWELYIYTSIYKHFPPICQI